ncbi:MAG: hypothetical protein IPL94_03645 [Tetrasphaera sp.]|jgi:hypothetical protein|nr:hypothetical protein [Tetrasphaera sp.]
MAHLIAARQRLLDAIAAAGTRATRRDERGDVPGWVLITLMTAALALLVWGLASDRLQTLFEETFANFGFN